MIIFKTDYGNKKPFTNSELSVVFDVGSVGSVVFDVGSVGPVVFDVGSVVIRFPSTANENENSK